MSRIWSRFGFRTVAVLVLTLGMTAGVYAGVTREASTDRTASVSAYTEYEDRSALAEEWERASRNARREARQQHAQASAENEARQKADAAVTELAELVAAADAAAAERQRQEEEQQAQEEQETEESDGSGVEVGPIPESCSGYSGNRAIGCTLLLEHGFGLDQMPCLDNLWTRESNWNERAQNPSSGAYGIPQALPGNKMASAGDDWRTNPATQITWGLGYIRDRYGTPCAAWQHSQETGWY